MMCLSRLFLLMTCAFVLAGCGLKDDLEEMGDRTQTMSDTTNTMYHQMRSKEAQETRSRGLENLERAQTLEEKLTHAVAYVHGFEFQLWSNGRSPMDDNRFRNKLLAKGVSEFFRAVQSFYQRVDAWDVSPSTDNNDELNLFALSLVLHETHMIQDEFAEKDGFTKRSFLDMIKGALKKEAQMNDPSVDHVHLTEWEEELLFGSFRDTALGLLNMRFQILAGMALNEVSDVGSSGFLGRLNYLMRSWDSKFHELNAPTRTKVIDFLTEALATRDFLDEIGTGAELNSRVSRVYSNMRRSQCGDICRQGDDGGDHHLTSQKVDEFNELVERLLN